MRPFAHALVLLCVAWAALILLTPAGLASERLVLMVPGAIVYEIGGRICHQISARSFHLFDMHQLPVCARCTGIYLSGAVGALVGLTEASDVPAARARRILCLAALPTAVSWGLEAAGFVHPPNLVRFAAALPLGYVAAWLVIATVCAQPETAETRMV